LSFDSEIDFSDDSDDNESKLAYRSSAWRSSFVSCAFFFISSAFFVSLRSAISVVAIWDSVASSAELDSLLDLVDPDTTLSTIGALIGAATSSISSACVGSTSAGSGSTRSDDAVDEDKDEEEDADDNDGASGVGFK